MATVMSFNREKGKQSIWRILPGTVRTSLQTSFNLRKSE